MPMTSTASCCASVSLGHLRVLCVCGWQDPINAKGGKWTFKLKKGLATYCWESLVSHLPFLIRINVPAYSLQQHHVLCATVRFVFD